MKSVLGFWMYWQARRLFISPMRTGEVERLNTWMPVSYLGLTALGLHIPNVSGGVVKRVLTVAGNGRFDSSSSSSSRGEAREGVSQPRQFCS